MAAGLPLMNNILTLLAKSVLLPLEQTAGMVAAIQKNILRSGMTTSIISNKEMEDLMKQLNLLKNQVYL